MLRTGLMLVFAKSFVVGIVVLVMGTGGNRFFSSSLRQPAASRSRCTADSGQVPDDEDDTAADVELQPGDEEDEPEGAPFLALKILKDTVGRSKMHPIVVIRLE